ncbi:hypothetical protein VOLCADRAFT_77892, partial [Volvox carteri f. nagariensis]
MSYQSNDVVEALVREYLVRAGCTASLEAFNREKPKHANSITKREILRKSLGLEKATAYYKKQNPAADGLPSTLEVWVIHQMAKLSATPEAAGPIQLQAQRLAPAPARPIPRAVTEPEEVSVPVASSGPPRRPASGSGAIPSPAAVSTSASPQGAVPAWRRRGMVDVLRKSVSGKSRSRKSLALKVSAASPAQSLQGASGRPPETPTASRSRRSLARPPSIMPRLAPMPQTRAGPAAAPSQSPQSQGLTHLPPVRGATKHRPSSRMNVLPHLHRHQQQHMQAQQQMQAQPLHPHAHVMAAAAHVHAHAPEAASPRSSNPPSFSSSPSKACAAYTATSSVASPAASCSHSYSIPSMATPSTSTSTATTVTPTSSAATTTTAATEPDLRGPRWEATASSSHEGGAGRPAPVRQGFGFGET